MAVKSKTYAVVGSVITGVGMVALILSFASDRWIESSDLEDTGFRNMGLWSVCFKQYRPPSYASVSREYDGCWWALDKELDDLRSFLFPGWFESTQGLVTAGLVFGLIVVILLVVNFINCFPHSAYKQAIKRGIALVSGLLLVLGGILLLVAVILFAAKATNSRSWLQKPDNNYLSWSYGMCILADFLFFIAGMCLILQFLRLRAEKDDPDNSDPKVMLTDEPPPATNYRYTPGRDRMVSEVPSNQPGYVQRYANNTQTSLPEPHPPKSMFAVSGAGEVYINRLADYDEKYNNNDFRDGYRERGRKGQPAPWHQPKPEAKKAVSEFDTSIDGTYTGSDYEKSKKEIQPVLPEYTPRTARKMKQANKEALSDSDTLDSENKDEKKKKGKNTDDKNERTSRSKSKKKHHHSRDRSRSGSRSRKKNLSESEISDSESTKKRSKHRSRSRDLSEDEKSKSKRRSRKSSRDSKRRRRSRSRSKSRDNNTTYSDSQFDSDSGSVRSRSRKRSEKNYSSQDDLSRGDKKRRSSSSKGHKKKKRDGNISDDKSGSEYSHKRSRRKEGRDSDAESKRKFRDFSETESVRSGRSHTRKPKGTYSSYYE